MFVQFTSNGRTLAINSRQIVSVRSAGPNTTSLELQNREQLVDGSYDGTLEALQAVEQGATVDVA